MRPEERLLIALGFFVFIGFAGALLSLAIKGQQHYRLGELPMNPLRWTAVATLLFLLAALVQFNA